MVRAIRNDRGFEVAWICEGCDREVTHLWCGKCRSCQAIEQRHRELIAAIKSQSKQKE
jgi:hypothetical protein